MFGPITWFIQFHSLQNHAINADTFNMVLGSRNQEGEKSEDTRLLHSGSYRKEGNEKNAFILNSFSKWVINYPQLALLWSAL